MTVISVLDLRLRDDALEAAPALIAETLTATRQRPGCLGVDVTVDVTDPAHYVIVERWESLAADDDYRAWRASPEGASSLGTIVAAAPVLTRCELHSSY